MKRTRRIPTAEARRCLRSLLELVGGNGDRIHITRYGQTMAGLISPQDLELLESCEGRKGRARQRR
jgi:PHD/YefM family antitoxin component YafN of YafNO toxin-antitoxin module